MNNQFHPHNEGDRYPEITIPVLSPSPDFAGLEVEYFGQIVPPFVPEVSVQDWFTELPRISLGLDSSNPSAYSQPFGNQQPPPPPPARVPQPATIIEVKSSPPPVPSQYPSRPLKRSRRSAAQPVIVLRSPSPTPPRSPSLDPSPSPSPKVPSKRKGKGNVKAEPVTEMYGLFIEMPKKQTAKKGKLSYDQYGVAHRNGPRGKQRKYRDNYH